MLQTIAAFLESRGGTMFVLIALLVSLILLCVSLAFISPGSDRMYVFLSGVLSGQIGQASGSFFTMLKTGTSTEEKKQEEK